MATTTSHLTFEEFERMPDEPGKQELLHGELIQLPPAKLRHMRIALRIHRLLQAYVVNAGSNVGLEDLFIETGYKLGPDAWLVPDVSIAHAGQPSGDYLEGAPALAVEVISDSNTADHMDRKVKTYLANGAREVWVVYPKSRSVWLFQDGHAREFRDILRSEAFAGLTIDLTQVFA